MPTHLQEHNILSLHFDTAPVLFVVHQIVRGWCAEVHDPENRSQKTHTEFATLSVLNWRFVSLRSVALQTSSAFSTPQKEWATQNFVPPPVTEKSNWIHELSLRSFSATANSASWFSPPAGLSVSGAVINVATSRIRHGSYVVNPPCLRVPNFLSRIPTVKQIEPLLSAIRAVIHKPSRCQSKDTCPSHQFLVSTPKFSPNPVSDASSRDKIQAVYSDGRRCDHSSPRCGVSVNCPQCGLFCEKVVPVELLETVVLEQKSRLYTRVFPCALKPTCPSARVCFALIYRSDIATNTSMSLKPTLRRRQRFKKHKKPNQNLYNATRQ